MYSLIANFRINGVVGTFGRADVPQRLINQSLYQEILHLQKFNYVLGKVLKPKKKSASNLKKKMRPFFSF